MAKAPTLKFMQDAAAGTRLVVLAHGIFMDWRGLKSTAEAIVADLPDATVAVFDYDWTQPIEASAAQLAVALRNVAAERIDLVGYSMGGLVCRRAVADHDLSCVHTVVTLASPNRGAVTPGMLGPLRQDLLDGLRMIAPRARCPGLLDLTDFDEVMIGRRADAAVRARVARKRYASVPALFHHENRPWRTRATPMGPFAWLVERLVRMDRPHDGIVCETSNDVTIRTSTRVAEFDAARGDGASPARCHAAHVTARELDHQTILGSPEIATLLVRLIETPDWTALRTDLDVFFKHT